MHVQHPTDALQLRLVHIPIQEKSKIVSSRGQIPLSQNEKRQMINDE
jgi:hypothetical protein